MPPAIIDAANAHRAALLAREQATMQAMAQRWLGVERSLTTATEALALQMANGEEPVTAEQLMLSRRYQELRRQLNAELRRYNAYAEQTIEAGQRNMITDALTHSQALITAAALEAQMVIPFNRLPVSTVERMAGLAGDGSPLMSVLNDATAGAGDQLAQRLVSGVALGQNPIEVARQAIRNGVGQSFTRIATIGRTEMLRAYRVTTLEQYQASRVVTAYRRLSARDERTCPACLFADGQVYELGESFDQHPNCRCTLTPILRNVPPVQYETGQQWFTRQPEGTQLAILGRGRYDLWRRGEASLDDMISRDWSDTWGGSLRVTSVGDLRNGRTWAGGGPVAPMPVQAQPLNYRTFENGKAAKAWAQEAFSDWKAALGDDRELALEQYASSAYSQINHYLRFKDFELDAGGVRRLQLLDSALDSARMPESVTAYRGFYSQWYIENFDRLTGTIVTDEAFVSTSLDPAIAENFSRAGFGSIFAEVRIPESAKAAYISHIYSNEAEILIARGTQFRVISATVENNVNKLILEVISGN